MNFSNNVSANSAALPVERLLTWEQQSQLEDFGFSAVDPPEDLGLQKMHVLENQLLDKREEAKEYKRKYKELKEAVLPILMNLKNTADKDHIYWPNRKDKIDGLFRQLGWDPEKPWE